MNFTKMQGAGNDFIVIEDDKRKWNWGQLAGEACDRHFGIGADGLIVVLPSKNAHFKMREFNPDGSEAEACGNGLRCLGGYVVYCGLVKPGASREISVETMAGLRKVRLIGKGTKLSLIQVSLGKPKFAAEEIPVAIKTGNLVASKLLTHPLTVKGKRMLLNFVSMGNPHAVFFTQETVTDFPLSSIGPEVEQYKLFPKRINFEVARVIDRKHIEARVWERGVGETLACGSGACAAAVAARLHGYADGKVDITLPGGTLNVEWQEGSEAMLSGPAEVVFTGEWPRKGEKR